jgi:plastocyanin
MIGVEGDGRALLRASLTWALRWLLLVAVALAAVAVASGAAPAADPGSAPAATVEMSGRMRYEPASVRIRAGETVLWRNASTLTHTVTADRAQARLPESVQLPRGAPPFHSGMIGPAGSWRYTFTVPGTYRYFCVPHETQGMVGTVEVVP